MKQGCFDIKSIKALYKKKFLLSFSSVFEQIVTSQSAPFDFQAFHAPEDKKKRLACDVFHVYFHQDIIVYYNILFSRLRTPCSQATNRQAKSDPNKPQLIQYEPYVWFDAILDC